MDFRDAEIVRQAAFPLVGLDVGFEVLVCRDPLSKWNQAQRAWPKHFAGPEFEIVVSSLQTVLSSRFNKREAGGNQLLRNMVRIIPRKRY